MSNIEVLPAGLEMTTGESYGLDPANAIILTVLKGWDGGGTMRRRSTARLNAPGDFSERGEKGSKVITVHGDAAFGTPQEAAQFVVDLEANMADGSEGILRVNESDLGLTRHMYVYLTGGVDPQRIGSDVTFIMDFIASDPFKYGDEVLYPAVPAGVPLSMTNTGTAPIVPTFMINGELPAGGVTITNTDTGRVLRYVESGYGLLVIDGTTGKCTLGGANVSRNLTTRQWTLIERGETAHYVLTTPTNATLAGKVKPKWY